jgi:predicted transcriptional regulator
MAIQLSPELEQRLLELARRENRSPESIITY